MLFLGVPFSSARSRSLIFCFLAEMVAAESRAGTRAVVFAVGFAGAVFVGAGVFALFGFALRDGSMAPI